MPILKFHYFLRPTCRNIVLMQKASNAGNYCVQQQFRGELLTQAVAVSSLTAWFSIDCVRPFRNPVSEPKFFLDVLTSVMVSWIVRERCVAADADDGMIIGGNCSCELVKGIITICYHNGTYRTGNEIITSLFCSLSRSIETSKGTRDARRVFGEKRVFQTP